MADSQITCINLSTGGSRHEHITHAGNGSTWRWTVAQIVASIREGSNTFFVLDSSGNRAKVGWVDANPPYIRTYADGVPTDNLLALSSCPI
jgi:hypothetical protein